MVVGLRERAGVVPEGGRLREHGTTCQFTSNRETRILVGTAGSILASWHPGGLKGGPSLQVQCGGMIGEKKGDAVM